MKIRLDFKALLHDQPKEFILFYFVRVYWKKLMSYCIPCIRSRLEDSHSICLKSHLNFSSKAIDLVNSKPVQFTPTSLIRYNTLSWSLRPMMIAVLQTAWILVYCGAIDILGKHSTLPLNTPDINTAEIWV